MKKLIAIMALMGIAGSLFAVEDGWKTDFKAASAKAKAEGKYMLLDFSGSDWCGWCIKLDDEVFSKQAFKEYAKENLVLVLVDFPQRKPQSEALKKQNNELKGKYKIRGYPTVIILDSEGKFVAKTGYKRGGADEYVTHLKTLISKKTEKPTAAQETAEKK